jgi:hypothetical protein
MHDTLLVIAVSLAALGLVVQALAALGMYRNIRRLREQVEPLVPEVREAIASARQTLASTQQRVEDLSAKTSQLLDSASRQLREFDAVRVEITERFRVQSERLELVADDAMSRFQEISTALHSGVMKPVREVSGLLAGVRAAFQTFLSGRRPAVDRATQDEEMFI